MELLGANKGFVTHTMALPFTLKWYLKAKEEELWKLKYFTMQKLQSSNNPLKETQNPSIHYNSRTNLKFQHNLAKISSFKNPHIKNRPIIIIIIIITINYRNHT